MFGIIFVMIPYPFAFASCRLPTYFAVAVRASASCVPSVEFVTDAEAICDGVAPPPPYDAPADETPTTTTTAAHMARVAIEREVLKMPSSVTFRLSSRRYEGGAVTASVLLPRLAARVTDLAAGACLSQFRI